MTSGMNFGYIPDTRRKIVGCQVSGMGTKLATNHTKFLRLISDGMGTFVARLS